MLAHWCVKGHGVAEILLFDLYGTLVDPLAIAADLTEVLGADGSEVSRQWRAKQLEYSFRLTVMGSYLGFRAVTAAALEFALASAGLSLTSAQRRHLVERYDHLPPLADAAPALRALPSVLRARRAVQRHAGHDRACLASSGLDAWISQQLSADDVHAYKPSRGVPIRGAAPGTACPPAAAGLRQRFRHRRRRRGRGPHSLGEPRGRAF